MTLHPETSDCFSSETATQEPDILYNKSNWRWDKTISDFGASEYTLEYLLVQQVAQNQHKITLTASANGDVFEIDEDAAASVTNLEPGEIGKYSWQAYLILIADTDDRTFYAKGVFDIQQRADLEEDPRTHDEIMRDTLEAFIQGTAGIQDKKMSINDRSIETYSLSDWINWQQHYQQRIDAAASKDDAAKCVAQTTKKIRTNYEGMN